MTAKRFHIVLGVMSLLAIGASTANFVVLATPFSKALIGSLTIPVIWICVSLMLKRRRLKDHSPDEQRFFFSNVVGAASIIVVAQLLFAIGDGTKVEGFAASFLTERGWGIFIGIVLLVTGNVMPKILPPFKTAQSKTSASRKRQHFAGTVFVLAGIGYILAWAFLPLSTASPTATLLCALAVFVVAVRSLGGHFPRLSKKEP